MAVESFALSVLEKQEQEEVGLVVVVKKDFVGLKVWREWKFGVWIVRAEIAIVLWSLYIVTLFWIALSYLNEALRGYRAFWFAKRFWVGKLDMTWSHLGGKWILKNKMNFFFFFWVQKYYRLAVSHSITKIK